jgi:hypothetical protein
VKTSSPPSAAAAKRATARGIVPDAVAKLTFVLRKFSNTNMRIAPSRSSAGTTFSHVRLALVETTPT